MPVFSLFLAKNARFLSIHEKSFPNFPQFQAQPLIPKTKNLGSNLF
jgi:hypothetical protein